MMKENQIMDNGIKYGSVRNFLREIRDNKVACLGIIISSLAFFIIIRRLALVTHDDIGAYVNIRHNIRYGLGFLNLFMGRFREAVLA